MRNDRFYEQIYATACQRVVWEHTLRTTTTLYPIARKDPIFTPLFTTILSSAGFGLSAGTISTLAGLGSAIATTTLSGGIITQ